METYDCDFNLVGFKIGNLYVAAGMELSSCLLGLTWQGGAVAFHIGPFILLIGVSNG